MEEEATAGAAQRLANRFFLKIAGRRFRAYSIVKHTGRRSGRHYQNPVSAYPLGDGFVIPVLYGSGSQWVRNVMANGGCVLRTKGRDFILTRPEIIPPSQAFAAFPRLLRRTMRSRKIQSFVWAHRVQGGEAGD
jgi:deazaflavin-dependent oxidoreductase (nitroreductase family)